MRFVELNQEEFVQYLETHPLRTFFQLPAMDSLGEKGGWTSHYVGIKNDHQQIIAASRMMSCTTRFGKRIFYAPRGMLVDYENKELLTFFTQALKKFIKSKHGYVLHIDPPLLYKERDIDGNLVEGGFDHHQAYLNLQDLGYLHGGFIRHYEPSRQVRWGFVLPLENKTEDDILKGMKGNTRRTIGRAMHYGVTVRELGYDELDKFIHIMDSTSIRRHFSDRGLDYYQTMYQIFHDQGYVKYMLAEVHIDDTIKVLQADRAELLVKMQKENIRQKQLAELNRNIAAVDKKIATMNELKEKHGEHLELAAGMFMFYGDEVIYYYSGSYGEYMIFGGQHLIQWRMIQEALKQNKKNYNFYGIKGVFDPQDSDYGVYEFKKGFNGHVIEYIGDFFLPISSYYYIEQLARKLKQLKRGKS